MRFIFFFFLLELKNPGAAYTWVRLIHGGGLYTEQYGNFPYKRCFFSKYLILCLHDLSSLSPKLCFFARSGPPFVIRGVLIGWGWPGLQMVDLSERENRLWGRERGDRANTELNLRLMASSEKLRYQRSCCFSRMKI